ncbi:MAG: hypothetical protein DLM59_02965 [Pseudonocardiales bacterium]|nr:MAG: hypothetical protein DLM59_02965 [Pseudonocardiales bacterium]
MEQTDSVSKDFWLSEVRAEGRALRAAAGALDLDLPVPPCPGWSVRDLVVHLGKVYVWVSRTIAAGDAPGDRSGLGPDDTDVLGWFDAAFAGLLATLEAIDPGAPAWNWSTQPDVAAFWPRRMAHETAVHRWDAQMAAGVADPVQVEWAVDGISEVLDTWLPAGRGVSKNDADGLVRVTASDADRTWLVRLRPEGVTVLDESALLEDDAGAQTGVAGTASDLLLALWGRLTPDALALDGDPTRFDALRVG